MNRKNKRLLTAVLILCIMITLLSSAQSACATGDVPANAERIELTGSTADFSGSGVSVDGSVITISNAGSYILSGTLENGKIVIDTGLSQEKCNLILDGVKISNADGSAIYVEQAKKVRIYMTEGTENIITSGTEALLASFDDTRSGAAIYSEDDLDIKGPGMLIVNGYINNGITCKDDFDLDDGTVEILAANNGIRGSESVEIKAGKLTVVCGNDGLKATSSKAGKGYITISGGTVSLSCGGDGISAITDVTVSGGDTTIVSSKIPIKTDGRICHVGGNLVRNGE